MFIYATIQETCQPTRQRHVGRQCRHVRRRDWDMSTDNADISADETDMSADKTETCPPTRRRHVNRQCRHVGRWDGHVRRQDRDMSTDNADMSADETETCQPTMQTCPPTRQRHVNDNADMSANETDMSADETETCKPTMQTCRLARQTRWHLQCVSWRWDYVSTPVETEVFPSQSLAGASPSHTEPVDISSLCSVQVTLIKLWALLIASSPSTVKTQLRYSSPSCRQINNLTARYKREQNDCRWCLSLSLTDSVYLICFSIISSFNTSKSQQTVYNIFTVHTQLSCQVLFNSNNNCSWQYNTKCLIVSDNFWVRSTQPNVLENCSKMCKADEDLLKSRSWYWPFLPASSFLFLVSKPSSTAEYLSSVLPRACGPAAPSTGIHTH